jgi:hypothetical protein
LQGLFWPEPELAIGFEKLFRIYYFFCDYVGSLGLALRRVNTTAVLGRMARRILDPGPFRPYVVFFQNFVGRSRSRWLKNP